MHFNQLTVSRFRYTFGIRSAAGFYWNVIDALTIRQPEMSLMCACFGNRQTSLSKASCLSWRWFFFLFLLLLLLLLMLILLLLATVAILLSPLLYRLRFISYFLNLMLQVFVYVCATADKRNTSCWRTFSVAMQIFESILHCSKSDMTTIFNVNGK